MDALTRCFVAWRVIRAGPREIIEGQVAPEHRGPSPALRAALAGWPHAHYWGDADRTELVLVRPLGPTRREPWALHAALLLVTIVCALGAGAALAGTFTPPFGYGLVQTLRSGVLFFPEFLTQPTDVVLSGWRFAAPLLTILLVHEMGHYVAARRYAIDASPPFFLPIPPTLSPIGSLGAFLRLRSAVVDRRQLLDVGAAGPLAGFVVALAVLAWGYATSVAAPDGFGFPATFIDLGSAQIGLGDSLLTHAFRDFFHPGAAAVHLNLPAFAGWAGALITGLNLLPLSQLDGGHVAYGFLGRRQGALALLTVIGLLYLAQYSFNWYIWVGMAFLIGGGRLTHPPVVIPDRPVSAQRSWVGVACLLVFVVTFVPIPFGQ